MFGRWRGQTQTFLIGVVAPTPATCDFVRELVLGDAVGRVYEHQLGRSIQFVEDEESRIDGLPYIYCTRREDHDAIIALLAEQGIYTRPVYEPVPEGCV